MQEMDSRQFAILVLAIFISTLALAFGENATIVRSEANASSSDATSKTEAPVPASLASGGEPTNTTKPAIDSSITTTNSAASIESSTTATKSAAPIDSSPTTATKSAAPIDSSPTAFTGKVELVTGMDSKPAEASAANATAAPTASSTDSSKSTQVVNDHSIRDVSSEKCSAAYNAADKVNWVPEKAIFAVLEENAVVTVEQLCKHLDVIKRLDAICNNTKVKLDSDDIKVAPIVAGLSSMFSTICSDTKTLSVPAGNSTPCVELIQSTTKNCSTNSLAKALHVFPTEVLFEEMVKENCTVVFNTKECIINALGQSDKCTEPQRAALKQAINMVTKVLPCSLPISPAAASTEAPSIATPPTTTPTVTTTKPHSHSSANGFQVNFFTVLPVLLLAFKFY